MSFSLVERYLVYYNNSFCDKATFVFKLDTILRVFVLHQFILYGIASDFNITFNKSLIFSRCQVVLQVDVALLLAEEVVVDSPLVAMARGNLKPLGNLLM
jgi:hypothetical protein